MKTLQLSKSYQVISIVILSYSESFNSKLLPFHCHIRAQMRGFTSSKTSSPGFWVSEIETFHFCCVTANMYETHTVYIHKYIQLDKDCNRQSWNPRNFLQYLITQLCFLSHWHSGIGSRLNSIIWFPSSCCMIVDSSNPLAGSVFNIIDIIICGVCKKEILLMPLSPFTELPFMFLFSSHSFYCFSSWNWKKNSYPADVEMSKVDKSKGEKRIQWIFIFPLLASGSFCLMFSQQFVICLDCVIINGENLQLCCFLFPFSFNIPW